MAEHFISTSHQFVVIEISLLKVVGGVLGQLVSTQAVHVGLVQGRGEFLHNRRSTALRSFSEQREIIRVYLRQLGETIRSARSADFNASMLARRSVAMGTTFFPLS